MVPAKRFRGRDEVFPGVPVESIELEGGLRNVFLRVPAACFGESQQNVWSEGAHFRWESDVFWR